MSADTSSVTLNKSRPSGLSGTKYFQYDTTTRTLTFLYDGFLDSSNVKDMGISHDTKANVIEPSDPGKQCVVICNYSVTYPSLPMPVSKIMFKDIILIRPRTHKPTGKYGASFKIGIPRETLKPFVDVATKSGYAVEDNIDFSNDHYWMNCTTDDSADALFYLFNKGVMSKIGNWYEVLHTMTNADHAPCNTVACAKLDLKLKTSIPDVSVDVDSIEARNGLKWTISAKMYACYLTNVSDVSPINTQDTAVEFHSKLAASVVLLDKLGIK